MYQVFFLSYSFCPTNIVPNYKEHGADAVEWYIQWAIEPQSLRRGREKEKVKV